MRRLFARFLPPLERIERRLFPVLAVIAGLSLVAGLVGSVAGWRGLDQIGFVATILVYGIATQYLRMIQNWVRTEVVTAGLPDWVGAQAEKNLWKGGFYSGVGLTLAFLVIWAGFQRSMTGLWVDGLMAVNLAFQVGAFAGEFVVINAQGRLFRNVQGWAKKPEGVLGNSEL